jgi:5'(3')-deoxyribonucleotidase
MDGVLVQKNCTKLEFQKRRLEQGFFLDNKPVDMAVESFIFLSKHCNVFILSTPVWDNIHCWTEKRIWTQKYLGDYARKKLILTHDKSLNFGKLLIDDSKDHGAGKFRGTQILFGSAEFPTWKEVLESVHIVK